MITGVSAYNTSQSTKVCVCMRRQHQSPHICVYVRLHTLHTCDKLTQSQLSQTLCWTASISVIQVCGCVIHYRVACYKNLSPCWHTLLFSLCHFFGEPVGLLPVTHWGCSRLQTLQASICTHCMSKDPLQNVAVPILLTGCLSKRPLQSYGKSWVLLWKSIWKEATKAVGNVRKNRPKSGQLIAKCGYNYGEWSQKSPTNVDNNLAFGAMKCGWKAANMVKNVLGTWLENSVY